MAEKKETEFDLDALMQGAAPGIEPWVEENDEEKNISPKENLTPLKSGGLVDEFGRIKRAEKEDKTVYPTLPPETYSKADIEKLMDEHKQYLENAPKEGDANKHNEEFEQTVIGGTKDIEDFASGLLSVEPDALDAMEDYINTFGKEYIKGSYVLTPTAEKALARIKDLRAEHLKAQEKAKEAAKAKKSEAKEPEVKDTEKAKLNKFKEVTKKKPQDRSLEEYLFLKETIENNPRQTPEQKAKAIESLTSQARLKMKDPNKISKEEYKLVPVFIEEFGYDKDKAINKDARNFRDAMDKRIKTEKEKETAKDNQDNVIVPIVPIKTDKKDEIVKKEAENKIKETQEKDNGKKKGFFARAGDHLKRQWKKYVVGGLVAGAVALGLLSNCNGNEENKDNDKKDNKKETVVKKDSVTTVKADTLDVGLLKQASKRLGHQDKISAEDAVKETLNKLEQMSKLPQETKAKIAGETDLDKLVNLVVVRGDQDKLKQPIDALLAGEKINPLALKDISERSQNVTSDFGANKENNLENGRQSIDAPSAYQIQQIVKEKGMGIK